MVQFNIWLEDTNALSDVLQEWKTMNAVKRRPSRLVIELYLDTAKLTQNQTLVVVDDEGKRWSVDEALEREGVSGTPPPSEVVYERWTISLDDPSTAPAVQLTDAPPNVYKKGVVLLRSLWTYLRFLPAWKLGRRMNRQAGNVQTIKPRFRIFSDASPTPPPTTLTCPLTSDTLSTTEDYHFAPLLCGFGPLNIQVTYRTNTDFHVESAEQLLSEHLLGAASGQPFLQLSSGEGGEVGQMEYRISPKHGPRSEQVPGTRRVHQTSSAGGMDVQPDGPSPSRRHDYPNSTRAGLAATPSIQAVQDRPGLLGETLVGSVPTKLPPDHRTATGSKSSLKSTEGGISAQRRPSVTFNPFKAGSLSSSPGTTQLPSPSPSSSLGRNAAAATAAINTPFTHQRNRSSLSTLPQQALRAPSASTMQNESAIAPSSTSSSPKPAPLQRYSSSFSNRRARFPSSAGSKVDEDATSSGRGSVSSARRSSATIDPTTTSTSDTAPADDSTDIADFLKLLDKGSRGLTSFSTPDVAANSARTAAQYNRFARMRDSTAQLSDSLSSSVMLHRSSTSSSRVPPLSSSSSPGKTVSPLTPHTPAVPSRLREGSGEVGGGERGEERDRDEGAGAGGGEGEEEGEEPLLFAMSEMGR